MSALAITTSNSTMDSTPTPRIKKMSTTTLSQKL